jgi:hypothetical protein
MAAAGMASGAESCGAGGEHCCWTGAGGLLPGADPAGPAVILIAAVADSPGEGPDAGAVAGGEVAMAAWLAGLPAGHPFRVLLSPPAAGLLHLAAINAGLQAVCLPVGKLSELQLAVGTRAETLITVDAHRHTVVTGKEFSAAFVSAEFTSICAAGSVPSPAPHGRRPPAADSGPRAVPAAAGSPEPAPLADRIRAAQLRISSLEVPSDVRIQLQRRLVAVCDATKAAGADPARFQRRLTALLAELDRLNAPSGR